MMINLSYVENPFDDDMMYSLECFRFEKTFYDVMKHKIFDYNDAFFNFGYTFHMYLIHNENSEWLGYILFHNSDLVNDYLNFIRQELTKLFHRFKNVPEKNSVFEQVHLMEQKLKNYVYETTMSLPILQQDLDVLESLCDNHCGFMDEYYQSVCSYLEDYPEYYYVDLIIALPLDVDIKNIENDNSSFINEVNNRFVHLIKKKFNTIPILLKNSSFDICLLDNSKQDLEILHKVKVKHNVK